MGGGTGSGICIPHPGSVKQRKPGNHWGAGVTDTGTGGLLGGGE